MWFFSFLSSEEVPLPTGAPLLVVKVLLRDTKISPEAPTHSLVPIREDFLCLLLTMLLLTFGSAGTRLVTSQGP